MDPRLDGRRATGQHRHRKAAARRHCPNTRVVRQPGRPDRSGSDCCTRDHQCGRGGPAAVPYRRGRVAAFLEGADIGGYSVSSDIQILERELAAAEVTLDTDTLRIVDGLRLWQKREPRKLTDAYQRFVGPIPDDLQPHDALDDVRMTVAVIERMANGQTAAELHAEAHPDMVDPAGKFRRDEHDRIVFAFGKHRGDPTDDHPDFLAWILNKDFPPSTLAVARRELDRIRPPAPEPNPGAQPVNTEANSIDDGEIPF